MTSATTTTTTTPAMPAGRAGRREWVGLAVLALPCLIVTMDLTVLFLAVPRLTTSLHPSNTQLLWISDVYGFLIAGTLIVMGSLGDRIGRRKVLLTGAAAFGAASLLAALSSSAGTLIAARAVQGLAGATLVPSVMAIAVTMFADPRQRTAALGILLSCFAAGAAVGPLLGGALLELFDWHAVFVVNLPVMAVLLWLGPRLLPESRTPGAGRVDLASAALSLAAILSTIWGIKEMAQNGVGTAGVAAVAFGVAAGVAFVARQTSLDEPLIDVRLFGGRRFSTALAVNMSGAFVMYGVFFFVTQYLQRVLTLSPLQAGIAGLPGIAVMMVLTPYVPKLAERVAPHLVIAGGLLLAAAGLGMLTFLDEHTGLALLIPSEIVLNLGIAPVVTLGMGLVIGAVPVERAGAASGLAETGNELGGALGIALLGSLGTAMIRGDLAHGGTNGAALSHGLQIVAGTCAVTMLLAAVAAAALLRPARDVGTLEPADHNPALAGV